MKENRNPNIKKQTIKKEYKVSIYLQLFLLVIMIFLAFLYLFNKDILPFLIGDAILFLWAGSYTSYKYADRRIMPFLYIGTSLLLIYNLFGAF